MIMITMMERAPGEVEMPPRQAPSREKTPVELINDFVRMLYFFDLPCWAVSGGRVMRDCGVRIAVRVDLVGIVYGGGIYSIRGRA